MSMLDDIISFMSCSPRSIYLNSKITSKIEMKKMQFGPLKCYKLHVGTKSEGCSKLKINDTYINNVTHAKYLGDYLCNNGSHDKSIESRRGQGLGAVSQITSLLNQVSLGYYYFDISLIFRDSLLVSKLIFNTEVWSDLSKSQYEKLEDIDLMYLRQMFSVPRSVPKESLYITCGRAPLRFVIQRRRLLYLWHLLHRDTNEIIYKYYLAQKLQNNANDWLYITYQIKKDLDILLDDEDIASMSKQKYKTYIDYKIFLRVRKYLENMRVTHSKCKNIPALTGKPETYIFSQQLQPDEIKVLYKLKTRMNF